MSDGGASQYSVLLSPLHAVSLDEQTDSAATAPSFEEMGSDEEGGVVDVLCLICKVAVARARDTVVRWPCGHYAHVECVFDEGVFPCRHSKCRLLRIADLVDDDTQAQDSVNKLLCVYRILLEAGLVPVVQVGRFERLRYDRPEQAQALAEAAEARRALASDRLGGRNTPMREMLATQGITMGTLLRAHVSTIELRTVCGLESWDDIRALGGTDRLMASAAVQWRPTDLRHLFGPQK